MVRLVEAFASFASACFLRFNSSMVRLVDGYVDHGRNGFNSFNSSMVRLVAKFVAWFKKLFSKFQFQYGAIGSVSLLYQHKGCN